jgi:hypothetical protein
VVEPVASLSYTARLDLLESSGVVTPAARSLTESAVRRIFERYPGADPEALDRLVTHVAMALTRVDRNEPEVTFPDEIAPELADRHEERALATDLTDSWAAALGRSIPDGERTFLIVHLAVLADQEAAAGAAADAAP